MRCRPRAARAVAVDPGDRQGRVEIGRLDNVEADHDLLGVRERAVSGDVAEINATGVISALLPATGQGHGPE